MPLLEIEPAFIGRLGALRSYSAIVEHFTTGADMRAPVFVTRGTLPDGTEVFFKSYRYQSPSWRFLCRASKARREFHNYGSLAACGARVAQRVAVGERRDAIGRLREAFIITVAVPGARTLIEYAAATRAGAERDRVFSELAQFTRAMHDRHFFYHDLVWRNVLVNNKDEVVFIDCPRGGVARFGRNRHRLRDLASLDKSAWKFCRRTERLRFILRYLGRTRVDAEARALVIACLNYRRKRWPEDWGGK